MRYLVLFGMVAGLGMLGGCTSAENANVRQEVQGMRQQVANATEGARQAAANTALEGKIKTALATRKGMETKHLDVEAIDGAVVLKGDVANREQAEVAERVAMETEGVISVDNQLMIRVPAKGAEPMLPGPAGAPSDSGPRSGSGGLGQ
ncbi:MAG: hypothetical protein K0Q72_3672 [Armatimonadetes bacterium]|jgi:hypothetical protein|nr:hypothetical protein [Armatimonadota bacterium]